mgnify:CR=1 FL=1
MSRLAVGDPVKARFAIAVSPRPTMAIALAYETLAKLLPTTARSLFIRTLPVPGCPNPPYGSAKNNPPPSVNPLRMVVLPAPLICPSRKLLAAAPTSKNVTVDGNS